MIILGINDGHNATAAILKDGKVIASASEERFTRVKNDCEYPRYAIDSCLAQTGLKGTDINDVAFAGTELLEDAVSLRIKREAKFSIGDYIREMHEYWKPVLIEKKPSAYWDNLPREAKFAQSNGTSYDYSFMDKEPKTNWIKAGNEARKKAVCRHLGIAGENVRFIDHHAGHAAYAYFASPHDPKRKAAVVTADSWGDGCNATVSVAENGTIKEIFRTPNCQLGRMYRWTTLLLGMKPIEHEYKVMGLAPYAPDYLRDPVYKIYKETLVVDGLDFKWDKRPSDMYFYFREKFEGLRFDGIAAGLQLWLEDMLTQWINNIMKQTQAEVLYFSGGLSMNVKANKVIAELPSVKRMYVAPSGGDESLAIGSAYFLAEELGEATKALQDAYLGYQTTKEECLKAVSVFCDKEVYIVLENPEPDFIAQLLTEGKVLGRCAGQMEFGARSLGNRAIICDPSKSNNLRKVNEKIKFRDFWMPFTPSILKERAHDYLVNPKGNDAYFMTIAFDSTPLAREHLKAAIHPYDFSVRPQLVSRDTNAEYYAILKAFEKRTGIGGVLNTSLNLHGLPIVCSAQDAVETLHKSGLDGMIFPGIIVMKREVLEKADRKFKPSITCEP